MHNKPFYSKAEGTDTGKATMQYNCSYNTITILQGMKFGSFAKKRSTSRECRCSRSRAQALPGLMKLDVTWLSGPIPQYKASAVPAVFPRLGPVRVATPARAGGLGENACLCQWGEQLWRNPLVLPTSRKAWRHPARPGAGQDGNNQGAPSKGASQLLAG